MDAPTARETSTASLSEGLYFPASKRLIVSLRTADEDSQLVLREARHLAIPLEVAGEFAHGILPYDAS